MAIYRDQKDKLLQSRELNVSRLIRFNPSDGIDYEGITPEVDDNKERQIRDAGISQEVHENT